MKIEKVKSRKYKDTQYYKHRIVLPDDLIESSGFHEGDELEAEAKKGEIKLKRKK
jgi:hypothetical protein